MKRFLLLLCLGQSLLAAAQTDTIKIVQYNLLNYGNAANPVSYKNPRLKTILQYEQPDVFGANEIRNDSTLLKEITDSVLGPGWSHGSYANFNNETQHNNLFWKSSKFRLLSQTTICHTLRDIVAFRLQYKDTVSTPHDTAVLTIIVAHLKASNGTAERQARALETAVVADYIAAQPAGNFLFMGDMNVYTNTEDAYQNLINNTTYGALFSDPIVQQGDWEDDAAFASYHTQSTRTTTDLGDGGATGGLDDRFDQILMSPNLLAIGDASVAYLPGSYAAVGQDGQHLNESLTTGVTDTAAPPAVITALYEMSDHLPVTASLVVHVAGQNPLPTGLAGQAPLRDAVTVQNPVSGNRLNMRLGTAALHQPLRFALYDLLGREVWHTEAATDAPTLSFPLPALPAGVLVLSVATDRERWQQKLLLR